MSNWPKGIRVALDTLGCKLNQAETELLARQLAEAGYELVSQVDDADVYILNTCTVTHIADRKARQLLRLAHHRNPSAQLIATGCYTQRNPQDLSQIEGVSLVLSNEDKPNLLRILEKSASTSKPESSRIGLPISLHQGFRTRSFIKVQDGCNSFCTYCIVPLVRGKEKSLAVDQIVDDIRHRIASGYKEVVLTGAKIVSYNHNGFDLNGLLKRILAKTEVSRLRISSLQPQEITAELLSLWRDDRLCRHFHLPLQSGSDAVLERMKRPYSTSDYQQAVFMIQALVPKAAITTDIIVGFPGESDEESEESYKFCKQMEFSRIHVFPYSPRPETQAAQMPNQVREQVKQQRSERMLTLAKESMHNFNQRFLGKFMMVLWEKQSDDGYCSGLTDNYIKVYTRSNRDLTNKLLSVKLIKLSDNGVWGELEGRS